MPPHTSAFLEVESAKQAARAARHPHAAALTKEEKEALRRDAAERGAVRSFAGFVRHMWPVADPTIDPEKGVDWAWYLQLLCEELQGLVQGTAPDGTAYPEAGGVLVVSLPPGLGKSSLCGILLPAWCQLHNPAFRLLSTANKDGLAHRDSEAHRDLLASEAFQRLQLVKAIMDDEAVLDAHGIPRRLTKDGPDPTEEWKPWGLAPGSASKINFKTARGGQRWAFGLQSKATGKRANALLVDDAHDAGEVIKGSPTQVAERLRADRETYHGVLRSRVNRNRYSWELIVGQRLGYHDLPGDLIRRGARVVCLPLHHPGDQSDRKPADRIPLHPRDPRAPGEHLAPNIIPEAAYEAFTLAPHHKLAQYEQYTPKEAGSTFQRRWFRQTYAGDPLELTRRGAFQRVTQSLDCMFKEGGQSWVVLTTWGERIAAPGSEQVGLMPGHYLLDVDRGRMGLFDTCALLRRSRAKWGTAARAVTFCPALVEEKAAGADVIETMRNEGIPVIAINPKASKEARAEVYALELQAARVWFPEESYAPWLHAYIEEHVDFPGAADDQVDSSSQYFVHCNQSATDGTIETHAWVKDLVPGATPTASLPTSSFQSPFL